MSVTFWISLKNFIPNSPLRNFSKSNGDKEFTFCKYRSCRCKYLALATFAMRYAYFFLNYINNKLQDISKNKVKTIECLLTIELINIPDM